MRAGVVEGPEELGARGLRDLASCVCSRRSCIRSVGRPGMAWAWFVGLVERVFEGRTCGVVGVEVRDLAVGVENFVGGVTELVEESGSFRWPRRG